MLKLTLALCVFATALSIRSNAQITAFHYESGGDFSINQGRSDTIVPGEMVFEVFKAFDYRLAEVRISVNNFSTGLLTGYKWWYMDFAAPLNKVPSVGTYVDATRYPFESASVPGLGFEGIGRGHNSSVGWFNVLQAEYNFDGVAKFFAADFYLEDGYGSGAWDYGSIRINSSVPLHSLASPVPEPGTYSAFGVAALFGLIGYRRRQR